MVATEVRIKPQRGPQAQFVTAPVNEVFFGGARGGGKSYGVMIDWVYHYLRYRRMAKGVLFRRTMPELEDMQEKATEILPLFGFEFRIQGRIWRHPDGGTLKMRYLDRDQDAQKYQGHNYNWLGFDEAGSWPSDAPINKLRATLRSADGVPVRMVLTGNPGGPGHNWLKRRYIDPAPPKRIIVERDGDTAWTRAFIPSRVQDNRVLLKNDPGYIARIKQSGPDWLVRAWLEGDWDIVAGGAVDDVWNRDMHVVEPFTIPSSWYVDRSFDWGSSKPFSVGWWAESDGTPITLPNGSQKTYPRGWLFRIGEWYGWNGTPNEGLRLTDQAIGEGIREYEEYLRDSIGVDRVNAGPADSAIFDADPGKDSTAHGINAGYHGKQTLANRDIFIESDKTPGSRVRRLQALRRRLQAATAERPEEPGLSIFSTCTDGFIRTIPVLPRDDRNPEDVDTNAEDHCYDEVGYRLTAPRKFARRVKVRLS